MEEIHAMKSCNLSTLTFGACFLTVVFSVCGCDKAKKVGRTSQPDAVTGFAGADLGSIRMINPKAGGPERDPVVAEVLAAGTNATPFLLEMITNGSPSQVYDFFHYEIGDVAHRLLCDIYSQNFLWPVAEGMRTEGNREVTIQDYMAFAHAPGGRQKLQRMWKEYLGR